jgi:spoIIIJ-associated protein
MEFDIVKFIKELLNKAGFEAVEVFLDNNARKISVVVDDEFFRSQIPVVLQPFEFVVNLVLKRHKKEQYVVDINYYRKERERLIIELAKAGAKKAKLSQEDVVLPPMNSYERRLIHMEIASNPDLTTESVGEGKERHVVIKVIKSNQ